MKDKVTVMTPDDSRLFDAIARSRPYTDEEIEKLVLGIENHENIYEFIRTMDEFQLPEPLKRLQDVGEQFFRWVDVSDPQRFDMQLNRNYFRWTPVNRNTHGALLADKFFNKHGGIMRGTCLLCWMPGKLYRAWEAYKHKLANAQWERVTEKYNAKRHGVEFYDPEREGKASINVSDPGFFKEMDDRHPDDAFVESGEYSDE